MAVKDSSNDPAKTTPTKWTGPKDARDDKTSGKYPNYWTHKTRSGHIFTMDDSKDGEHITIQHRGGSMFQVKPDGAVQFVSHNGQYNFVFGENRIKVTGAYDITVEGGGSLKVDGDYNVNVKGDYNLSTSKDMNITAKNMNQTIRGNMDTQAKNQTTKVEGNIATTAHGGIALGAKQGIGIKSTDDSVGIKGAKQVALESEAGEMMLKSGGKTSIKSAGELAMQSTGGKTSIKGKTMAMNSEGAMGLTASGDIKTQGSKTYIQSGEGEQSSEPDDPASKFKFAKPEPTQKESDIQST